MTLTVQEYGIYKYEITDDLRLHVWNILADHTAEPPFYFQNEQNTGEPWESREQVFAYFEKIFKDSAFPEEPLN